MNTRNVELGRVREVSHNPRYDDDIFFYPKRRVKEEIGNSKSPAKVVRRDGENSDSNGYGEEKSRNLNISEGVISSVYAPNVQELKVGTMVQGKRQDVMLQYGIISQIIGTGRTAKYLIRFRTSKKKVLLSHSDFWLILPEDYWIDSGSDDEKSGIETSTVTSVKAHQPISKESVFQRIVQTVLKYGNITVKKLKNLQLDEDSISCYMPLILSDRVELLTSSDNTVGIFAREDLHGIELQLEEIIGLRGQRISQQEAPEGPFICDVRKVDNKDILVYYRFCGSMAMIRSRCFSHANCYTKDWVLLYTKRLIRKGEELGICLIDTPGMPMQCDICKLTN